MLALKRIPWKRRRAKAREWGAKGLLAQAVSRAERGPDLATQRARALDDRRGQRIRHGVTYHGGGRVTPWEIIHSRKGRSDQFDVIVSGVPWRTGGPRCLRAWLAA